MENNNIDKKIHQKGFQVSCYKLWEDYTECFRPYQQYQHIRRYGEALNCGGFYDDLKHCLLSKTQSKEKADAAYLASNHYKKLHEVKSESIFAMKSKPSWDWEDKDGGGGSSGSIGQSTAGENSAS